MTGVLRDAGRAVLDLIYPVKCVVCGDFQERYLCQACLDQVEPIGPRICDTCGAPSLERACQQCREHPPLFEIARSVGRFEGPLREAVHELKYLGKRPAAHELVELMVAYAVSHPRLANGADAVIPVPIHPTRERARGFNQADLLAKPLADALELPTLEGVLVRTRAGKPQVGLHADERRRNVLGEFEVRRRDAIRDRIIILVDDVFTTGSTADEAARVLMMSGARSVRVFTLARDC